MDADTLKGIAVLMSGHTRSRVLIEAGCETDTPIHLREPSPFVLAVVSDLVDRGGDRRRIHVECQSADPRVATDAPAHNWLEVCRVEVLLSDIEGHFGPTAGARVGGATGA
jgi:ferredoxin-NADP reductase